MVIKSRTTTVITLDRGGNVSHQYISKEQEYNQWDLLVSEKAYDAQGQLRHKTLYRYNGREKIMEKISFGPNDQLIFREDYFYDEHDQLIQTEVMVADESKLIKEHYYDKKENLEKTVINSEHGEILGYEVLWYSKKNQVVAEVKSDADQQVIYKRFATYNKEGRLLSEDFFGNSERLQKKVSYHHTLDGRILRILTQYLDEAYTLTEHFSYDSQQRLVKKTQLDPRKGVETNTVYSYDQHHQVIAETYQQEQLVYRTVNRYDAAGNLLEEETVHNRHPYLHEIRRHELKYW